MTPHTIRRPFAKLASAMAIALPASLASGSCRPDLSFIATEVEAFLAENPFVPGIAIIIGRDDEVIYERGFGDTTTTSVMPIASATKWITGAALMSLVDEGLVSLDTRVAEFIPAFDDDDGPLSRITLGHCFAHTSGLPAQSAALNDRNLPLQDFAVVTAIAGPRLDLTGAPVEPGAEFHYGGVSMQVAGAVMELAAGEPFQAILASRITDPLGMSSTFFPLGSPRVAGGLNSNAADYAAFLQSLFDGAAGAGGVLSAEAIDTLLEDQAHGAIRRFVPPSVPTGFSHGVGVWLDLFDEESGASVEATSVGAYGANAWLDRSRGLYGMFIVFSNNGLVTPLVRDLQRGVADAVDVSRADLSGDGAVGAGDLAILLGAWGTQGPGDLAGNGVVGSADLAILLGAWGPCPNPD